MMEIKIPSRSRDLYIILKLALLVIICYLVIRYSQTGLIPMIAGVLLGLYMGKSDLIQLRDYMRDHTIMKVDQPSFIPVPVQRWALRIMFIAALFLIAFLAFRSHNPTFSQRWVILIMSMGFIQLDCFILLYACARYVVIKKQELAIMDNNEPAKSGME